MAKYTVSLNLDCRVDIEVEANSFEEAFRKADKAEFDKSSVAA